jgi:hypothetical protein
MNKTNSTRSPPEKTALSEDPTHRSAVSPLPAAKMQSAQTRVRPSVTESGPPNIINAAEILRDIARMFADKYETPAEDILTHALNAERSDIGIKSKRPEMTGTLRQDRRAKQPGQPKQTH